MTGVAAVAMAATGALAQDTKKRGEIRRGAPESGRGEEHDAVQTGSIRAHPIWRRRAGAGRRAGSQSDRVCADRTRACPPWSSSTNTPIWSTTMAVRPSRRGDGRFTMSIRTRFQPTSRLLQDQQPASFAGPRDLSTGAAVPPRLFRHRGQGLSTISPMNSA